MLSNPLSGGTEDEPDPQDGYRLEILVNCRFLQRLDKIQVDAEERDEAAEIRKEREYAGKDEEDEWMNDWMNKWMKEWMNEWMKEWMIE